MLAITLCYLAAFALLVIGVLALIAPATLSQSYGVAVDDAKAFVYVRATGARDCLFGLILIASAYLGDVLQLMIICSVGLMLSLADLLIAFFGSGRRMKPELLAHLAGIVGFGIILVLLAELRVAR